MQGNVDIKEYARVCIQFCSLVETPVTADSESSLTMFVVA